MLDDAMTYLKACGWKSPTDLRNSSEIPKSSPTDKEIDARACIANSTHLHTCALLLFPLKRCDCGYDALDKLLSERDALEKENARLKNCLNADGLHDPELVKIAGKPVNIFDAAMSEPRTFDPSNPTPPKGNGGT